MKKEKFLISIVVIMFFSLCLAFNNNAMGALRQDADAAMELTTIRKNLSVYSKMKPEDAKEFYEDSLNELQVIIDMFAGTEEALEATFYIGATHNILKNFDEAIAYFDDVLSLQNEIDQNFKARLLYFKAQALIGTGNIEEAKDVITELRIIEPGAANAFGKELGGTMRLGMHAPDFHTEDSNGSPISLSQFEGKIIVMHFWASWNDQCLEKLPEIQGLYRKFKGPEVQFIGISRDDEIDDLQGVILQKNIEWPQIFEGMRYKGMMSKLYDVRNIPITFVLDRQGRVQYIGSKNEKITQVLTTLIVKGEKKSGY
ncbi:MAG: redoxin domain-containing protein [Candidatus Scalindua sp.]|nr:redoxin domain-containing protein [Candidatus Scalindua sp.]MBT5305151.1 redoxin domain-containing protein [Candidatus Scalindua sp.]MBT6231695.1 redoxin domain-containing protein [Candidatus Scalindua sp.]MBT6561260.1 redoxin domain-containing protein [Candidatus Scalindua sp.]MBT7210747.1 redoxin domain-containing protein [Candidatus Scalindua sp.]